MTILIPKILITKGFTMAFQTKDFGNLPYEFSVYDLLAADANKAWFGEQKAQIFASK